LTSKQKANWDVRQKALQLCLIFSKVFPSLKNKRWKNAFPITTAAVAAKKINCFLNEFNKACHNKIPNTKYETQKAVDFREI